MSKVLELKSVSKVYKIYSSNKARLYEIFSKKRYHREFVANREISFDLYEGETLGIIGVNGAGKSTLLKMIAGVIEPSGGEILRHGRVTALLELGTGFNDELSGYENIKLNGELIGMSARECEEKEERIIAFSELGDYIYEPIKSYSSGMKMRLAFSIALFSEPQILIVDEALSVGDAHFAAKCTRALRERKEANMSIIYVSHDLNSLKILCDRVILLDKGGVVEMGMPEEIINSYNYLISKLNDSDNIITISDTKESSFGSFEAEMYGAMLRDAKSHSDVISSGETVSLSFYVRAKKDLSGCNFGFLIKDKFGQDIYGSSSKNLGATYRLEAGCQYRLTLEFDLNIGVGKYSLSLALSLGDNHLDSCVHWLDYACGFEVVETLEESFIGVCRLTPRLGELERIENA